MPDHATSTDPAVQAQLDRLTMLSPGRDVLGLERISALLDRIGNPQRALPPVFHVAGTNGKGSTCAFLRAAIEAAGMTCHVYASPHLVRFNERIRVAGRLIDDATLAPLLADVLDGSEDIHPSFFEATTAAAFLAFARMPADACIVEVGLGGRLDATNVIADPTVCGIAQLGIDHEAFLGDTLSGIAFEKAGIAKAGRPLVTAAYPPDIAAVVAGHAQTTAAPVFACGDAWHFGQDATHLHYRDANGAITTPLPRMHGRHQVANLALAIAMIRHQDRVAIPAAALASAATAAHWPARMQRLAPGPLAALLPPGSEIWLDGGHNAAAANAVADTLAQVAGDRPVALVLGMLANKDAATLIARIAPRARALVAVPVPGHDHHPPAQLAQRARDAGIDRIATAPDVADALTDIATHADPSDPPLVLILGSLYLAGGVLAANGELPV